MALMVVFVSVSCYNTETIVAASLPIAVGDRPVGITYDSGNDDIYVTNAASHTLSVISGETNTVVNTILAGINPYAVAYNPVDNLIYVANLGSNDVSVINGPTGSVVKTIRVGILPTSIVYDPINHYIYVTNYRSHDVSAINVSNMVAVNITGTGRNPIDLAYDPDNGGIYVADAGSAKVFVINGATNKVIANVTVGTNPTAVTYNSAMHEIYVVNKDSGTISIIKAETNTVTKTVKVGSLPLGLAVNPNTNTIYVTHTKDKITEDKASSVLTVINAASTDMSKNIPLQSVPERVAVDEKTNMVYITNPDARKVSVVDGRTNKEIVTEPNLPYLTKLSAVADIMITVVLIPGVFIALWHSKKSYILPIRKSLLYLYYRIKLSKSRRLKSFLNYISSGWVWLSSGSILTILSLIILPLIVVLSQVHVYQTTLFFLENSQYKGLEYEKTASAYINYIIQGIFIVSLFFYPPFPAPYSSEKYFRRRGFQTAVIEYEYVKKILYIAVPLFIFLTIIPNIQYEIQTLLMNYNMPINLKTELQQPAYKIAQAVTFFIVFAGLLKIIFAITRKKFRLYFAKGCFEIVMSTKSSKKDEVQKMSYVIKGLHSYNLYLRRYLNLEINDIKSIYSKISRAPSDETRKVIDRLCKIFTDRSLENDTLAPVRYLFLNFSREAEKKPIPALFPTQEEKKPIPTEEFLTVQPIFNKIKDFGAFAAVIIPLAISMIDFYLTKIYK